MTSHGQKTGLKSHRQKEKIRRKRERERNKYPCLTYPYIQVINTFRNVRCWTLTRNRRFQSTSTNLVSLRSLLILSSILCLGVPIGLPFASSWTTTFHAFVVYKVHAEHFVHLHRLRVSPS